MNATNITNFLRSLKENNNREWFENNKQWYKEAKDEFEGFVEQLLVKLSEFDSDMSYLRVKDCTYRIHRDIRFSADKTPYKTNMGAYMVKGGKKSNLAGYYFHLEPDNSLIAGGIWMPPADILKKIRWGIYENIDEFLEIINNPVFKNIFPTLDEDAVLKTAPKEFPRDFPYIYLLRYKSYTVSSPLTDNQVQDPDLLEKVISMFRILAPFNWFLNRVVEM